MKKQIELPSKSLLEITLGMLGKAVFTADKLLDGTYRGAEGFDDVMAVGQKHSASWLDLSDAKIAIKRHNAITAVKASGITAGMTEEELEALLRSP